MRPCMMFGCSHHDICLGSRCQDAVEYLQYLLEMLTCAERAARARVAPGPPTAAAFAFDTEMRMLCTESSRLAYLREHNNVLSLGIPLAAATNKDALIGFQARSSVAKRVFPCVLSLRAACHAMRHSPIVVRVRSVAGSICLESVPVRSHCG